MKFNLKKSVSVRAEHLFCSNFVSFLVFFSFVVLFNYFDYFSAELPSNDVSRRSYKYVLNADTF